MLLRISHKTTYRLKEAARYGLQQLRVTPKTRDNQSVLNWEISLSGATKQVEFEDQHNNTVLLASIDEGTSEIIIESAGEVETTDTAGVIGQHGGFAPLWYFRRETGFTRPGKNIRKLVAELGEDHEDDLAKIHALSNVIADRVAYEIGTTDADTTAEAALEAGSGVCQDHAHILICAARKLNFPARYVSGYLMMNDRVEQEAGHAWAEIHIEPLGWVGFDISNRICPDARYVRVATGLDYSDAAPVSGMHYSMPGSSEPDDDSTDTMLVNIAVQQ